jgi:hypothetical protein
MKEQREVEKTVKFGILRLNRKKKRKKPPVILRPLL